MGTNLKALVIVAFWICIFGFIGLFCIPRWSNAMWGWRIGLGMGIIATGFILYRADSRKEKLPDLLAKTLQQFDCYRYFECDGLCFAPVVQTTEGVCWIAVFFQNRYASPCTCRVQLLPSARALWFGRHNLPPPINAELNCPGGAFGVCRFPYAVPAQCQGQRWHFDVYATTSYPAGKGELLRFRSGDQAGSPAFLSLAPGPGLCRLFLPNGVTADMGTAIDPITEILWQPDLPTNAFPVIPAAELAAKRDIGFAVKPEELP
ncbi:MAG TPA: hypothetical protein VGP94_05735 [Tepidisphaeraceae bacterium]|nr:hypothetical protein [Tepidisphaeraceae bacterium]